MEKHNLMFQNVKHDQSQPINSNCKVHALKDDPVLLSLNVLPAPARMHMGAALLLSG